MRHRTLPMSPAVRATAAALAAVAVATLLAACGQQGPAPDSSMDALAVSAPLGLDGFELRVSNSRRLRLSSTPVDGSSLTCMVATGTRIVYLGRESSAPPAAEATPIAIAARKGGRLDVYLVAPDGSWVQPITAAGPGGHHPSYSPDGTRISFSTVASPPQISTMDLAGGAVVPMPERPLQCGASAWCPDGRRLAFRYGSTSDGMAGVMTIGSTGADYVVPESLPARGPEWSPDGKKLVFASQRTGNYEIYILHTGPGTIQRLTRNSRTDIGPAWSPDGSQILFSSNRGATYDLYSANVDGSGVQPVAAMTGAQRHADWSPDGRKICYRDSLAGSGRLSVMNADGSRPHVVLGGAYDVTCTAWLMRRSRRVFLGPPGMDAGYDPPLGEARQAVIAMYDEGTVRSAVAISTSGPSPVEVRLPESRTGQNYVVDVESGSEISVAESLWIGQPVTVHLPRSEHARRCLISFNIRSGRVAEVTPY